MQEHLDDDRDWYEPDDERDGYEPDDEIPSANEVAKSASAYGATAMEFDLLDIAPSIPFAFGNVLKYSLRAPFKGQFKSDREKARNYAEVIRGNSRVLDDCNVFMYNDPTVARLLYRLLNCHKYEQAVRDNSLASTLIAHALDRLA